MLWRAHGLVKRGNAAAAAFGCGVEKSFALARQVAEGRVEA